LKQKVTAENVGRNRCIQNNHGDYTYSKIASVSINFFSPEIKLHEKT
jgi:hypothetical protein